MCTSSWVRNTRFPAPNLFAMQRPWQKITTHPRPDMKCKPYLRPKWEKSKPYFRIEMLEKWYPLGWHIPILYGLYMGNPPPPHSRHHPPAPCRCFRGTLRVPFSVLRWKAVVNMQHVQRFRTLPPMGQEPLYLGSRTVCKASSLKYLVNTQEFK